VGTHYGEEVQPGRQALVVSWATEEDAHASWRRRGGEKKRKKNGHIAEARPFALTNWANPTCGAPRPLEGGAGRGRGRTLTEACNGDAPKMAARGPLGPALGPGNAQTLIYLREIWRVCLLNGPRFPPVKAAGRTVLGFKAMDAKLEHEFTFPVPVETAVEF